MVSDEVLIKTYRELNSSVKVAKKCGIPASTAACRLKKLGVLKKWKRDISDNQLIISYRKHQSVRKVGEELGISHETARYKLKKLGVLNDPIVYDWNDSYFSQDTSDSFYWAGFIAADGCVKLKNKRYKQLSIGLAYKDHEHIEKFKSSIRFSGPIHKVAINTGGFKSEITISSEKIFDDLKRFNIVPRKSLIYDFPEWLIGHKHVNHFMRGYFDGDGSFYTSLGKNKSTPQLYFSLRGTEKFLTVFRDILDLNCSTIKGKHPRSNSGIYTLEYGGNNVVMSIAKFLYKGCDIKLDRKFNIIFGE